MGLGAADNQKPEGHTLLEKLENVHEDTVLVFFAVTFIQAVDNDKERRGGDRLFEQTGDEIKTTPNAVNDGGVLRQHIIQYLSLVVVLPGYLHR
jgi:hypothetical protein